mmetsp:Transcript_22111/g.69317  ORF Transcript_22111/g.69317 Transcript_22111/m.69317 type:complete len:317 (+) Transcript_22111:2-952(+)
MAWRDTKPDARAHVCGHARAQQCPSELRPPRCEASQREEEGSEGPPRGTGDLREDHHLLGPGIACRVHAVPNTEDDVLPLLQGVQAGGRLLAGVTVGHPHLVGAGRHGDHRVEVQSLFVRPLLELESGCLLGASEGVNERDLRVVGLAVHVRVKDNSHGPQVLAVRDEQEHPRTLGQTSHEEGADVEVPCSELQLVAVLQGEGVVVALLVTQGVLHELWLLHSSHLQRGRPGVGVAQAQHVRLGKPEALLRGPLRSRQVAGCPHPLEHGLRGRSPCWSRHCCKAQEPHGARHGKHDFFACEGASGRCQLWITVSSV